MFGLYVDELTPVEQARLLHRLEIGRQTIPTCPPCNGLRE